MEEYITPFGEVKQLRTGSSSVVFMGFEVKDAPLTVSEVHPGGMAEKLGIQKGWKIVAVGETQVRNISSFKLAIETSREGGNSTVEVTFQWIEEDAVADVSGVPEEHLKILDDW